MIRGLYTAASGMLHGQKRLDVAANNLANVTTPGFKQEIMVSKAYPENDMYQTGDNQKELPMGTVDDPPYIGQLNTGVASDGGYTNYTQGSLRKSQNPLDLAILGDGFFTIQLENGNEVYTRNGAFRINSENQLVTSKGVQVMGENGPLTVNPNIKELAVTGDGTIVDGNNQVLGKLEITQFENLQKLRNMGQNFYRQGPNNPIVDQADRKDFKIKQGALERSNTKPIKHVVRMIELNRLYNMQGDVMNKQNKALAQAIKTIGKA